MEKNRKIQIGLLAVVALLLIANLFGGGIRNWFGSGSSDSTTEASMGGARVQPAANAMSNTSGNIPGTNVTKDNLPQGPTTLIRYDNDRFEFGVVDEGEVVKHLFKFTNVGKEPLTITNCKGSCGCTVPTWPKEPIPPGASGEIKVEFNTKGKPGQQSKRVTVTANTVPTETFLEVRGEVRGKDQPAVKG